MIDFDHWHNQNDLQKLRLSHPIIHAALTYYERGDITYERALLECVIAMTYEQDNTNQALLDALNNQARFEIKFIERFSQVK